MSRIQKLDAERLVNALDQEIRSRGWGTIGAINTALGRSDSWWQQRVKSKDITVKQLLQVLDHLGLDPAKFVRQIIGSDDGLELDLPRGKVPDIVVKARARKPLKQADDRFGVALLNTLDDQKSQDPEKVVEIASWAVDHVELELIPGLLGVLGSAYWLQFLLDEAEHCIYAGIEIARDEDSNSPILANLLTRLSYVISNRGDRKTALHIAERATLLNLRHGDPDGAGRALVAQGNYLYYLDQPIKAIQTFEQALTHLHEHSTRNRFAALQSLGFAHQRVKNFGIALEYADAAQDALPDNERDKGKLWWLQARINAELERFDDAALTMEKVVDIFSRLHFGETALATCELVRIQLHQGQGEKAFQTASSMRALLEPLHHNKIISAAIADLLRSGREGLTLTLIKHSMALIEGERQNCHTWRLMKIRPRP